MNAQLLKTLLEGHYICRIRFPNEFRILRDEQMRARIDEWLRSLDMRLASLGEEEDEIFFVTPIHIGPKEEEQIKKELCDFRDVYGPIVLTLDFIRRSNQNINKLSPGEYIALYELEAAVAQSSVLQTDLEKMQNKISANLSHRDYLRRMLDQLVKDGYAIVVNKSLGNYQITGKIEQLYAVLRFLDENKVIDDEAIDDQNKVESGDLFENEDGHLNE